MKVNGKHVVTDPVRISYPHLFTPTAIEEGQERKYRVVLLVPKSDTKTVEAIQSAITAAEEEGVQKYGKDWKAKGKFNNPLRDADAEGNTSEGYEGHYFINLSNTFKPGVFDRSPKNPVSAEDADKVYPGCFCCVSFNFFCFPSRGGNKGISASLTGVLKAKEGERLGSERDAAKDFEGIEQFDDFEIDGDGEGEDNFNYDDI